LRASKKT